MRHEWKDPDEGDFRIEGDIVWRNGINLADDYDGDSMAHSALCREILQLSAQIQKLKVRLELRERVESRIRQEIRKEARKEVEAIKKELGLEQDEEAAE